MNGSGTETCPLDYSIRFKLYSVIGFKNFQVPLLLCTEINKCMGEITLCPPMVWGEFGL